VANTPEDPSSGHPFPESWEAGHGAHADFEPGTGPSGSDAPSADERLRSAVGRLFRAQPGIDPSVVAVTVADAEVTLGGKCRDAAEARLLTELASSVEGVRAVHDRIERVSGSVPSAGTTG
jgi:osmotically-inducible protein OsmY